MDFSADWCAACHELDRYTWSDPAVAREVHEKFVALKIDATADEVMQHVQESYSVQGLPTVLMMACRDEKPPECAVPGDDARRVTGYLPPPEMLERLRRAE